MTVLEAVCKNENLEQPVEEVDRHAQIGHNAIGVCVRFCGQGGNEPAAAKMGVLVADQAQHHAIEEEVSVVLIAKRAGANYKNVWRLGARAERALVTGQHAEQSE